MLTRADLVAGAVALTLHAGVAYGLARVPPRPATPRSLIEVEFRPRASPPPPAPGVAPPPVPATREPPARRAAARPRAATPLAVAPSTRPPSPAARPVYGVSLDSLGDASGPGLAMPVGDTTDPAARSLPRPTAPPAPLRPAGPPPGPSYRPASELRVKTKPKVDVVACGNSVVYPPEAQRQGIEGELRLRVSLDETGRVVDVRVVVGLGHGLDQAAVHAIKHKCKFAPAIATDGTAVAFVIPSYVFRFDLPR
ncbi:MAG: TonB family protein [Deltaproteobacteria bacterium]|nr:TonB family protein [Deltaproteobacteria bacterium]